MSKELFILSLCGWLGAPRGMMTCSHPGSLHHHAYTVFTALRCQPHCQLWECQHTSSLLPVESHETRRLLPVCWTGVGLWSIFNIQRPAVLRSIHEISSRWIKWMKCKYCFISFFYVVTSGCTGVLGAVGMLDVCAQYVVKLCGGISSQKHPVKKRRAPQGPGWKSIHLLRDRWPGAFCDVRLKYWPRIVVKSTLSLALAKYQCG